MFGLFAPRPRCPVDRVVKAWIDRRWAWLESEFGRGFVRRRPVITPTAEHFPEPYRGTEEDVEVLLDRVAGYMDLPTSELRLEFYAQRTDPHVGGSAGVYCGRGDDGRFEIALNLTGTDDPLQVVATLNHELAHVHLLGYERLSSDEPDHELLTDLTTVFFGLGIFNANATVRDRAWSDGQFSYFQISKLGYLAMDQYAYALAKLAVAREDGGEPWSRHLRPDVRKLFRGALAYLTLDEPPPPPEPAGTADPTRLRLMDVATTHHADLDRLHFVYDCMAKRADVPGTPMAGVLHAKDFLKVVRHFAKAFFGADAAVTLASWDLLTAADLGDTVKLLHGAGLLEVLPEEGVTPFARLGGLLSRDDR